MDRKERYEKIVERRMETGDPHKYFGKMADLCRELVRELDEMDGAFADITRLYAKEAEKLAACMSKPHSADYDKLARLRERDEVVRVYVEKGLELEDKYQPDTTWSQEARVLSDILAALDKQEDTDERKD